MLLANAAVRAAASGTEIDIRDYTYTFAVPNGVYGPWHVVKLDVERATGKSRLRARFVTGNRENSGSPSHGQYVRLEDAQTLSPCFTAVGGLGVGGGYMPRTTWTAELLGRPNARFPVELAVGIELSSITPQTYQRILAIGPNFRFGNVYGYARYYRPSVPGQPFDVAPSGAFDLGVRATKRLDVTSVFNVGGEIGGDRTASELPTSSGRYGPDAGAGLKYALTGRFGATLFYERAWYRQAPGGEFSRRQAVISAGFFVQ
jgi:hypothetical protein